MSTAYPIRPIELAYPQYAAGGQFLHGNEQAAQSFKRGAVLIRNATDLDEIEEAAADPGTGSVMGIATADAKVVTDADVAFMAGWGNVFVGQLVTDDDDDADDQLAVGDLFKRYGMLKDSGTSFWHIDKGETSAVLVLIIKLLDPVGTNNGRVHFVFLQDMLVVNS